MLCEVHCHRLHDPSREVGPLNDDGWQLLYLTGVPLDPTAAVDEAQAELCAVEASCEATRNEQLKGYSSKVRVTSQDAKDRCEIPTKGYKRVQTEEMYSNGIWAKACAKIMNGACWSFCSVFTCSLSSFFFLSCIYASKHHPFL